MIFTISPIFIKKGNFVDESGLEGCKLYVVVAI
jgi:hypothetical protein